MYAFMLLLEDAVLTLFYHTVFIFDSTIEDYKRENLLFYRDCLVRLVTVKRSETVDSPIRRVKN